MSEHLSNNSCFCHHLMLLHKRDSKDCKLPAMLGGAHQVLRVADIIAHQHSYHHQQQDVVGASPTPAGAVVSGTSAGGVKGGEMLTEADLSCDVNRWELLERGKQHH